MRRAVVDVGSNSVLLTVCEKGEAGWRELHWTSEVTGLGADTKKTGLLRDDAQRRTLEAVKRAFDTSREMNADCAAAATMAVRIATNAGEFLERAEAQGTPVSVLGGDEEAQLGLEAVLGDPEFAEHGRLSVIDPGGHSTELTIADRSSGVVFRRSFAIGALGLREGAMGADAPDREARFRAAVEIDGVIGSVPEKGGVAVGLGATPTNLVSIKSAVGSLVEPWVGGSPLLTSSDAEVRRARTQTLSWKGQPHPQPPPRDTNIRGEGALIHGRWLEYEEIAKAVAWLCEMSEAERAKVPGLEKGRERTIHIGALILERFLNALHLDGCFVSTRGWRHALLDRDDLFALRQ